MAALSILGLLFMIIPLAIVLASLVGLGFLWYRVFKGSRRGGDMPTCGRCGYAVRGLAGLNCPECGADLREVGIVTPALRGSVSPVVFVLLWTLLLPAPGCLVSGILVAVGPKSNVPSHMVSLTPVNSGQYTSIDINHTTVPGFVGFGNTGLTVQGNASQYEYMDIDPVAMTYEDWMSSVNPTPTSGATTVNPSNTTKPLDRQAILDTFKRAGADTTRQEVIDEADELLSIIRGIPSLGLANLSPTHFNVLNYYNNSYDQPAGWFILLLLLFWFTAWVAGMVYYFRIRKKHLPDSPRPWKRDPPRFAPPSPPPSAPSF